MSKVFRKILSIELNRLITRRSLTVYIVFLLLSLSIVIYHSSTYTRNVDSEGRFQEIEKERASHYINLTQRGAYGFRLMLSPSPLSILGGTIYNGLTANIDVSERFFVYEPKGGQQIPYKFNFVFFFSLVGSILVLWFSFTSESIGQVRSMVSVYGVKHVFFALVYIRVILLNVALSVVLAAMFFTVKLWGYKLFLGDMLVLLLVFSLYVILLASMGFFAGTYKKKTTGLVILSCIYFVVHFGSPFLIEIAANFNSSISGKSDAYMTELEKLKLQNKFEDRFVVFYGTTFKDGDKVTPEVKNKIQSFLDNEYRKMLIVQDKRAKDVKGEVQFKSKISALFPSPFLLSVCTDLGGGGHVGFIKFYDFAWDAKCEFMKRYLDLKFPLEEQKITNLVPVEVSLFSPRCRPQNLYLGIVMMIIYIAIFFVLSYSRFKEYLFRQSKSFAYEKILSDTIVLSQGLNYIDSDETFREQIIPSIFGFGTDRCCNVVIENAELNLTGNVLYLPKPNQLPGDLPIKKLVKMYDYSGDIFPGTTKIKHLSDLERQSLLLSIAKDSTKPIIVLDDFMKLSDCLQYEKDKRREGSLFDEIMNKVKDLITVGKITVILRESSFPLQSAINHYSVRLNRHGKEMQYIMFTN